MTLPLKYRQALPPSISLIQCLFEAWSLQYGLKCLSLLVQSQDKYWECGDNVLQEDLTSMKS